jgi:hypothetical protein
METTPMPGPNAAAYERYGAVGAVKASERWV